MDANLSKEDLIAGLQTYAEQVESVPTVRGMRNEGPYSPHYYKQAFGSWHNALRAADIQPTHGVTQDVDREALLADLRHVDKQTDRPPRRRDVETHGEYPYTLYEAEFDSFVLALEEAGIEPDEKQYRFSSVETPEELRGSANIEKLRQDGPTPADELPQDRSMKDRQHGMWDFTINSGSTTPATAIHYLRDEHAPELVIRRFFRYNPHVLKYREPHGIKIEIKDHQSSWKEIGREIVDELVEKGAASTPALENLVIIRTYKDDALQYCFETSVSTPVVTADLPLGDDSATLPDTCSVWGFTRDTTDIWEALSENDGFLFSTRPGVFTGFVPVVGTTENNDVMTDLWVEYEDGVRSGGIEQPRPYLVFGSDHRDIEISTQEFADELDTQLEETPVQRLDSTALEPFLNSYGRVETYLREQDQSSDRLLSGLDPDTDPSIREVVDALQEISDAEFPIFEIEPALETIDRKTREAAFREGIYEIYDGCAICGAYLEAPDGGHNLEAAHILPKSENGPDVLQNGLALCARHHWAFDAGWFEITTDYEIRVTDAPDLAGYDELNAYDGTSLRLPGREDLRPHPAYIKQRAWGRNPE